MSLLNGGGSSSSANMVSRGGPRGNDDRGGCVHSFSGRGSDGSENLVC
jgi:hypothetical protein